MLFLAVSLLVVGLVQADQLKKRGQCLLDVYVEKIDPSPVNGNSVQVFAGHLSDVSAEAISALILDPLVQQKVEDTIGPHRRLRLNADCLMWPGWNMVEMTTSAKTALIDLDPQTIQKLNKPKCFDIELEYPQDPLSWTFELTIFPHTDSNSLVLKLHQVLEFSIFPKGESKVPQIIPSKFGLVHSLNFFDKFACLLEVNGNASWPISDVPPGKLLFMAAKSPITPESEWKLLDLDYRSEHISPRKEDMPVPEEVDSSPYDVTRIYARNTYNTFHKFAPFVENSLYRHVGFTFTKRKR